MPETSLSEVELEAKVIKGLVKTPGATAATTTHMSLEPNGGQKKLAVV